MFFRQISVSLNAKTSVHTGSSNQYKMEQYHNYFKKISLKAKTALELYVSPWTSMCILVPKHTSSLNKIFADPEWDPDMKHLSDSTNCWRILIRCMQKIDSCQKDYLLCFMSRLGYLLRSCAVLACFQNFSITMHHFRQFYFYDECPILIYQSQTFRSTCHRLNSDICLQK